MNDALDEMPVIIAQSGPLNGQRWKLQTDLIMGREGNCEIVVPDRQVSRRHARLYTANGGVHLEDMGSKNGTHHNGSRIQGTVLLQDGDVFQIALAQEFVYISADATMPLDSLSPQPVIRPQVLAAPSEKLLRLEKRSRQVWVGEDEINPPLSVSQFRLLELLFEQDGKVVPRNTIVIEVWGDDGAVDISNQALDALIRRLRDRLAATSPHNFIVTVRGHGLRIDNPLE